MKTPNGSRVSSRLAWFCAAALWVAAVATGSVVTWRYASTEGTASRAPTVWPESSRLARASGSYTLVMFVHTHCPCSRASLTELSHLMARVRGRVHAAVVFVRPDGVDTDLVEITLRTQAENLPDTLVINDTDFEAELFGAHTSGATLLYDRNGTLVFAGGLTSVRGHEGNSFGQERIVSLVTTGRADRSDSPVFGCSLEDEEAGDDG